MMTAKILYVIAPDKFRDEEYLVPTQFLANKGYIIETISTQSGLAKGMFGAEVNVLKTLDDINPEGYGALVIAGGMGSPEHLWENSTLRHYIKAFVASQKLVCAICISGVVLAKAGVLTGKKATVWLCEDSEKAYTDHGVQLIKEPVVIDGLLLTANGPEASLDFAKAIDAVLSKTEAKII